jgi:hypothetical protein
MRAGAPRESQELADNGARQGFGQVRDDIHAAARHRAIEQRIGARLDARAQRLHGARGERPAHRVAQPRVVRRVAEQHRLPVAGLVEARGVRETVARAGPARSPARAEVALKALATEPRIAEDRGHVGVPREHPEPVWRAVHGVLFAQLAVEAVRIGEACRAQALEEVDRRGLRLRRRPCSCGHARGGRATGMPDGARPPGISPKCAEFWVKIHRRDAGGDRAPHAGIRPERALIGSESAARPIPGGLLKGDPTRSSRSPPDRRRPPRHGRLDRPSGAGREPLDRSRHAGARPPRPSEWRWAARAPRPSKAPWDARASTVRVALGPGPSRNAYGGQTQSERRGAWGDSADRGQHLPDGRRRM